MSRPLRWLLSLVGIAVFLGWLTHLERSAESRARAFCGEIAVGSSLEAAAARAAGVGDERLRRVEGSRVVVGFTGIPPFSRHLCEVTGTDGKVQVARYLHLD